MALVTATLVIVTIFTATLVTETLVTATLVTARQSANQGTSAAHNMETTAEKDQHLKKVT